MMMMIIMVMMICHPYSHEHVWYQGSALCNQPAAPEASWSCNSRAKRVTWRRGVGVERFNWDCVDMLGSSSQLGLKIFDIFESSNNQYAWNGDVQRGGSPTITRSSSKACQPWQSAAMLNQWKFQDPKMEVLHRIPYQARCWGAYIYIYI
jgi:hypothetical protein